MQWTVTHRHPVITRCPWLTAVGTGRTVLAAGCQRVLSIYLLAIPQMPQSTCYELRFIQLGILSLFLSPSTVHCYTWTSALAKTHPPPCPLLSALGHTPPPPCRRPLWMTPFWILLELRVMEEVVMTGAIRCPKLQSINQHPTFLQARCHSCRPTNSVKVLKGKERSLIIGVIINDIILHR